MDKKSFTVILRERISRLQYETFILNQKWKTLFLIQLNVQ